MKIKKIKGVIVKTIDLSPTAKEVQIKLSEPLEFHAGSFVNIFMSVDNEIIRRAYSISGSNSEGDVISVAVRLTPTGKVSPIFWSPSIINREVEVMGPLGINTVDKMHDHKKYLVGFGIGAGVIKSLAEHLTTDEQVEKIHIMLGFRNEEDILFKPFFDELNQNDKATVQYVLSKPNRADHLNGYVQDHVSLYDFNNSDVYICGQEKACKQLQEKIQTQNPTNCKFFVEGFH